MVCFGKRRTEYTLAEKPITEKGEGAIYPIIGEPNLLAKIYHKKSDELFLATMKKRQAKILNMINDTHAANLQYLAWPVDALTDRSGNLIGFVMKRFYNMTSVSMILPIEAESDWKKRVIVAHNLCDVVNEVHKMHQVIGDMNPENFGVNITGNCRVCGFDVDSFHYRDQNNVIYPCIVGLAPYYAPELQVQIMRGEDMRTLNPNGTFTVYTDRFALAVLIFQLLFMGYHPFTGAPAVGYGSSYLVTRADKNILNRVSPYFNPIPAMTCPATAPPRDIIPPSMQVMFYNAFLGNAETRPSATEWQSALWDLFENTTKCSNGHFYYNELDQCPWCKKPPRPHPAPEPIPPKPKPSIVKKIAVVHADKEGHVLKEEAVYLNAGESIYVNARNIEGYYLISSQNRVEVKADSAGNASLNKVLFTYDRNSVGQNRDFKTPHRQNRNVWILSLVILILFGLVLGLSSSNSYTEKKAGSSGKAKTSTNSTASGQTRKATAQPTKKKSIYDVFARGKTVRFGKYLQRKTGYTKDPIEWIVLSADRNKSQALLISKYGLEERAYSLYEGEDIYWRDSDVRKWLNKEFYSTAFSENEKSAIITAAVDNSRSQGRREWNWDGYGGLTFDDVFLLSYQEVMTYFDSNQSRICYGTNRANGGKRDVWWIRTPGFWGKDVYFSTTSVVFDDGDVYNNGENGFSHNEETELLVRPAIWVDLAYMNVMGMY